MDTLVEIESTLPSAAGETAQPAVANTIKYPLISPQGDLQSAPQIDPMDEPTKHTASHNLMDDSDEFGDDEDLFAADMEQVASLYDKHPDSACSHLAVSQVALSRIPSLQASINLQQQSAASGLKEVINLDASDDEFGGDDIDVEQFAAAEVAATQACNGTALSPAVRIVSLRPHR